jgi:hypothetical protein
MYSLLIFLFYNHHISLIPSRPLPTEGTLIGRNLIRIIPHRHLLDFGSVCWHALDLTDNTRRQKVNLEFYTTLLILIGYRQAYQHDSLRRI